MFPDLKNYIYGLSKVLIYAVIDWNSIPLHIKEIEDKDKFKAAVAQYFSQ